MSGIKAQKISVKKENGFLYVDVLLAVTIFLLMLPISLGLSQKTVEKAKATYEADYLVQDAIRRVEAFKGQAYSSRTNHVDDRGKTMGASNGMSNGLQVDESVMASNLNAKGSVKKQGNDLNQHIVWEEEEGTRELGGLNLEEYRLEAYDKERFKYSLTVYVYRK